MRLQVTFTLDANRDRQSERTEENGRMREWLKSLSVFPLNYVHR